MESALLTSLSPSAVRTSAPAASSKPSEASVSKLVVVSSEKVKELTKTMGATFAAGRKREASDQAVEVGDLLVQRGGDGDLVNAWRSYVLAIQWNKDNTVAIQKLNAAAQQLKERSVGKYTGVKMLGEVAKS